MTSQNYTLNFDNHLNIMTRLMISFQYKPQTEAETKQLVEVYYQAFRKCMLTDKQLTDAAGKLVVSWTPNFGRKYPTIKDFVDAAGASPRVIGIQAYTYLKRQIIKVGANGDPKIQAPGGKREHRHHVASAVIRSFGGWVMVCDDGIKSFEDREKQFLDKFEELYFQSVSTEPLLCSSPSVNEQIKEQHKLLQIGGGE